MWGLDGRKVLVSYGASKAALDNITRVSALELGRHGIRVNSVNPTVVMTDMSAFYWGRPEIGGPFLDQMPLRRWATEDETAAPIVFLLGDGASMISGVPSRSTAVSPAAECLGAPVKRPGALPLDPAKGDPAFSRAPQRSRPASSRQAATAENAANANGAPGNPRVVNA